MSGISVSHLRSFFNKKSYNMKLHLPKGLRTALLAVIGTAAVYTTTSQAAPAAAYESAHVTQIQIREDMRNNSAPSTAAGNFGFNDPVTGTPIDFNETDWGLTIDILNFTPAKDPNTRNMLGGLPITNAGYEQTTTGESITLNQENSFAIFISNYGQVRVITNVDANTTSGDIMLFDLDYDWVNNKDEQPLNMRLSFSWDADGGAPDILSPDRNKHFGSLTFNGAYMLDADGNIQSSISSGYEKEKILTTYVMRPNMLSITQPREDPTQGGGMYALGGAGSTVMLQLDTPGDTSAWAIRGDVNLNYLLDKAYYKDTMSGGVQRKYENGEVIEFRGSHGVLYLTEGTYTYDLPTSISNDPSTAGQAPIIGFGAQADCELTVSDTTLNSTIFSKGCGIRIMGDGTVILKVNTTTGADTPVAVDDTTTDDTTTDNTTPAPTPDDTTPDAGDGGLAGGGEDEEVDEDAPTTIIPVNPTLTPGTRTITFAEIGNNTTVKLDVIGNSAVTAKLGSAASVGSNASIIKTETSGDGNLIVDLNGSDGKLVTTYIDTIANKNGNLDIEGKQTVTTTDRDGNPVTKVVYAQLGAKKLEASRDVNIEARVRVSESITSGLSVNILDSTTEAGSVTAGGNLFVGQAKGSGAKLIVSGEATAKGLIDIYGQARFGSLVAAGSADGSYVTVREDAKLSANSISSAKVYSTACDVVYNAGADKSTAILSDGISIDNTTFTAGTIAGNTSVAVAEGATLTAGSMKGSLVYLGAMDDASNLIMYNASHENGVISITANGTTATGTLKATYLTLPKDYTLKANNLEIENTISSTPELNTDGLDTKGKTVIKNASISSTNTTAASIEAESIEIAAEHNLTSGALTASKTIEIGDNATVSGGIMSATNGVALGTGATLKDAVVKNALAAAGDARLSNVTIEEALTTSADSEVILDKVAIATEKNAFGGTDGKAFQADDTVEVKSITLSGTLTTTADDVTLNATAASIDAKNLEFSKTGDTFTILKGAGNNTVEGLDDASKIDLYVSSYTWADVKTDGNKIVITGNKDEEGIKAALTDTEARKDAMEAIESATMAEDGVLTDLHDAMGDVLHKSNEQRQEILDAISGASTTALADSQRRGIMEVQGNLRNRIVQMGGNADWETAGIQAWAQADASFSSSDSGDDGPGYDYNTWGATVGANVDLSETVTVGMSFSASYGELDVDSADNASGNNDAYYVNLFARHQSGRWMQMLIFTAGMNDMDLERNVNGYTGEGSTDGTSFSAYYELGYTLGLNDEFTHILQPMVNARISSAKVDGYTEKGSIGDAALEYDGDSYVYGSVGIGVRYQGVIYESVYERNAVLELRAQVTQDFGDCTDEAGVRIGDGDLFTVTGTDTTGTGFDIGAGISAPIGLQTTLFADADVSIRPDYTGFRANVGLRYDF